MSVHAVRQPIQKLTPEIEQRVAKSPLLNIDTFIIPSPYIRDSGIKLDYEHSYYWDEEGEILGCIQVYSDTEGMSFHIYKIVTSPFSRGRGIGTTFIEHLASDIPQEATVYLYVWEKQPDTIEYFRSKGFSLGGTIVYRTLVYYHLSATPAGILEIARASDSPSELRNDDIGRARHDARKTIRFLSHMVDSLSAANSGKIIEDINRETTTLVNTLNRFRDTVSRIHEVNLRDLILERIIPYVEASSVPCRLHFSLDSATSQVLGYYVNISRALINIVSNALDAIREKGEKGILHIDLRDRQDTLILRIKDNGIGMTPQMLERGEDGLPAFVGRSTKSRREGEGLGSIQIFSVFGAENVDVISSPGKGAIWTIRFDQPRKGAGERLYTQLERRFHEFHDLTDQSRLTENPSRTDIISFIWQIRKMEIYLYDLILLFSREHNIRSIYRFILSFWEDRIDDKAFSEVTAAYKGEHSRAGEWLYKTAGTIKKRMRLLQSIVPLETCRSQLFRSYGQAIGNVIIFTLDPESGNFYATDRKLAEHLDFAPYLGKPREQLLRGEFNGDVNNHSQPIMLGVWSLLSEEDLDTKLQLLQQGARRLLDLGIHVQKRLLFYQTTYVHADTEINPNAATTVGEFSQLDSSTLRERFTRPAERELDGFLLNLD
jgi:GNAT superfamily N-acetyltransferase